MKTLIASIIISAIEASKGASKPDRNEINLPFSKEEGERFLTSKFFRDSCGFLGVEYALLMEKVSQPGFKISDIRLRCTEEELRKQNYNIQNGFRYGRGIK